MFSSRSGDPGIAHGLDPSRLNPRDRDHPVRVALLLAHWAWSLAISAQARFTRSAVAEGGWRRASEVAGFGVLSLVFWAIVLPVAIKYVVFVMRADNEGEGGRWRSCLSLSR